MLLSSIFTLSNTKLKTLSFQNGIHCNTYLCCKRAVKCAGADVEAIDENQFWCYRCWSMSDQSEDQIVLRKRSTNWLQACLLADGFWEYFAMRFGANGVVNPLIQHCCLTSNILVGVPSVLLNLVWVRVSWWFWLPSLLCDAGFQALTALPHN